MKWKKGKYVGVEFTPDQKRAQRLYREGTKRFVELCSALRASTDSVSVSTRENTHKRLDKILDGIERQKAEAIRLFPDVEESCVFSSARLDDVQDYR